MSQNYLKIENLTKKFDDYTVLDSISSSIEKGSIYGLIGTNGAGKSTLLNCISGIYFNDNGFIFTNGEKIEDNVNIKDDISYISDEPYFFNSFSMKDMAKYLNKVYPSFSMDKFYEISNLFPLDITKKINTFSKGMKRQAAIVFALSKNPKLLLCDESFDGLDPVIRQLVKRIIIKEVTERSMTVIVSSHNLAELENFCDVIGIIHQNKIIIEKKIDDIKENIHKIQLAFKPMIDVSEIKDVDIVKYTTRSSVMEIVARGKLDDIIPKIEKLNPILIDPIDISLEDIFIYEMEVTGYDASKVLI
ncbi:MAG: ABC transporter ATP-binding protein [Ruminococcaceae bacterium]|nr:ABC transporter ATP-binding protein [Oscillospiraceae bacterium]